MLPVVQFDSRGLYTMQNLLSQVPPGAMTVANNIVIDRPGIAETRRGFALYGNALPSPAIKGFAYDFTLFWYLQNGSLVSDAGAGVWHTYAGTYTPSAGAFINSAQASGNFYWSTNNGVYKLDAVGGTPRLAGVPGALDLQGGIAGAGNAVVNNSQVGYQILFGYTDANGNLILGAPSEYLFVGNNSGTDQKVTVTATIPSGVTTEYFVQVYRTANTGSFTVPPGNNFQLAIEHQLTSGEISAKAVTITDNVPDSLLGAFIYTADGQPGNFPNNTPPLCVDLCTYNGMTFYANYQTVQTADLTLDAVGAPSGIQIGDTFTITDTGSSTAYIYTGGSSNNPATRQFLVDGSGSIAQNIDATARNLVAVINQDPSNTLWYAQYITGENILPGAMTITTQNFSQGTFFLKSSRQTCWTPPIPVSGNSYLSSNNARPNGFLASKVNQPEAVPLAYEWLLQAGQTNIIIYRILALQDAAYAFTSGGIFRITGTDPTSLQILLFDSSAHIFGNNTPVILNNSIFYCSTQGVCSVSSGGNQIMSRNIERDLLRLEALTGFPSLSFGVPYESDRKYFLFTPTDANNTAVVQSYVYNWITQAWTFWTRNCTAGVVSTADDKLYLADASGNIVKERKTFTVNDYADESYTLTITATSTFNNTLLVVDSSNVQIGDIITETVGPDQFSTQVVGNNLVTGQVFVVDASGFAAGTGNVYRSIATEIQFAPIHGGFAEYVKKFTSWQFAFSTANFTSLRLSMSSDFYPGAETVSLVPISMGGWGTLPWGTFPWGVSSVPEQIIPTWPTRNTGYAHWVIINLYQNQAFAPLALNGVSATFDIVGTRGR